MTKRTPKQRVLRKWPKAKCWNRGTYLGSRRCWQVWNGSKQQLLGMAMGTAAGAWSDAARRLKERK